MSPQQSSRAAAMEACMMFIDYVYILPFYGQTAIITFKNTLKLDLSA